MLSCSLPLIFNAFFQLCRTRLVKPWPRTQHWQGNEIHTCFGRHHAISKSKFFRSRSLLAIVQPYLNGIQPWLSFIFGWQRSLTCENFYHTYSFVQKMLLMTKPVAELLCYSRRPFKQPRDHHLGEFKTFSRDPTDLQIECLKRGASFLMGLFGYLTWWSVPQQHKQQVNFVGIGR